MPFVGEIRIFGGNYAPMGWAFCWGQLLSIWQNDVLFSLIGTTYGGDGQATFCLPDLRGRVPVHQGGGYWMGQRGGAEAVTPTPAQLPGHSHTPQANSGTGTSDDPANRVWAAPAGGAPIYSTAAPDSSMGAVTLGPAGGSQSHNNVPPFLAVNFIIALNGIYPARS